MNLCTNAGHAMKDQGGFLEVTLEETEATDDHAIPQLDLAPGAYLHLKVADTGNGIPPDVMERIFDPFFTTKPPGEGTGLGLSAVHGIVKSLRGALTVSSEPGKGSSFSVYLPVLQAAEFKHVEEFASTQLPPGHERILLVDDEEAIVRTGETLLQNLGYKVRAFMDSMAAWEEISANPTAYDAVITDYTMPRLTGIELSRKIREIRPDIPIVICSGYISFTENLKTLGAARHLTKPVTIRDLAHALRFFLDRPEDNKTSPF